MLIKIDKGLEIPLRGAPASKVDSGNSVKSVAVLGRDYVGLRPRMMVDVGDRVEIGQPLFFDKRDPLVMYTAPGGGKVSAINRGDRRALRSVVIQLDGNETDSTVQAEFSNSDPASLSSDSIRTALFSSGLWTALRARPFSNVPQSDSQAAAIFVTAMDTRPLAGDPEVVVAGQRDSFATGLTVLTRLTDGPVFVCTDPDWNVPLDDHEKIRHVRFAGVHPAGLPGTHIHHLLPVGANRAVWHIDCQDIIAIGQLFGDGRLCNERTVALGGAPFTSPRMITARLGANIDDLVAGEIFANVSDTAVRLISGSLLSGRTAHGSETYLGRYHYQVTAVANVANPRMFAWLRSPGKAFTAAGMFRSKKMRAYSTGRNGRRGALLPIDAFENILPLDLLPIPLLRALLVGDTDQAQALGCLELDDEDLALCSFVCPGKTDYGAVLRANLAQIEREG